MPALLRTENDEIFMIRYSINGVFSQEKLLDDFAKLDRKSGDRIINPLFLKLAETPADIFEDSIEDILAKCINVNRSFFDAVKFLSIWINKSPNSLLRKLKNEELKEFFNKKEYDYYADQWHFSNLLAEFSLLIKIQATPNEFLKVLNEVAGQKELFDECYNRDCKSGEGIVNCLVPYLNEMPSDKFEKSIKYVLEECININRAFSNTVKFLSIWIAKSSHTLIRKLKAEELKTFFNRTEYDHDGDEWLFPKLLIAFSSLISEDETADKIMHYLFENFDFVNMPDTFISLVIGYDRLERCVGEIPVLFKEALLKKIQEMIDKYKENEENKTLDIGSASYRYLQSELSVNQLQPVPQFNRF